MIEPFFQAHAYLMQTFSAPVRRSLADNIDWSYRLIGIRGPRGVGRTSFLLQYAKENFDPGRRKCLYINLNNFYFQGCGLVEFAGEFVEAGGSVLLVDQAFKLPDWQNELCKCFHAYPYLRIVYTTTPVTPAEEDTSELSHISRTYVLHGFSFREFINLQTGSDIQPFSFEQLLHDHHHIARSIVQKSAPLDYFEDYLDHGYYPFYLENHNFTEALLKAMNMMIEVDILFNKQVELKYLARIKRLLFLLTTSDSNTPNVSRIAEVIGASRATVMNYLKYLEEARLINMVYRGDDDPAKKPAAVLLHDTNLICAVSPQGVEEQRVMETFFVNTLWRHHIVHKERRDGYYRIDNSTNLCVCDRGRRVKTSDGTIPVRYNCEMGREGEIPLWLFGFLY